MTLIHNATQTAYTALALLPDAVPTPGDPTAPPGFGSVTDVMGWIKWGCLALLVIALMIAGARLGFGGKHGDGEEHAGRIGRVLVGCMVVGAAGSLIGFIAT